VSAGRTFVFEARPTRAQVVDAVSAALEDEGLQLREGSWGRLRTVIDADGSFVVLVPSAVIVRKEA